MSKPAQPPKPHWSISVSRDGENLVTIESNCLCGKPEFTDEEAQQIRDCADHLRAFIGEPPSPHPAAAPQGGDPKPPRSLWTITTYDAKDRPTTRPVCLTADVDDYVAALEARHAEAIAALELAEGVATGRLAEVASERDKAEAELSELRTITEPWQAVHHLAPWQCVFGAFHPVEEVEKARQAERAHYCAELTTLRDQLAAAQDALRAADHLMAENVQSMLPASGWLSWRAQHRAALDDLGSQEP